MRLHGSGEDADQLGFKPADAAHVAAAEQAEADVLLSCDDRMCRTRDVTSVHYAFASPIHLSGSRRSPMPKTLDEIRQAGLEALRKARPGRA